MDIGSMVPIVLAGSTGTLGRCFRRVCEGRALRVIPLCRGEADLTSAVNAAELLERHRPWAVINAAGYVRVDDAEREPEQCHRANVLLAESLAKASANQGIPFLTFSSDLVFDGAKNQPYQEADRAQPLSVYGQTKLEAEQRVRSACPGALVIRTSAFFGPWDDHNFVTRAVRMLRGGMRVDAAGDVQVSPTYIPDLADTCLDLLIDGESGLWHLSNGVAISWADFAIAAARAGGAEAGLVRSVSGASLGWRARRPRYSALGTSRGQLLPPLSDALTRWAASVAA